MLSFAWVTQGNDQATGKIPPSQILSVKADYLKCLIRNSFSYKTQQIPEFLFLLRTKVIYAMLEISDAKYLFIRAAMHQNPQVINTFPPLEKSMQAAHLHWLRQREGHCRQTPGTANTQYLNLCNTSGAKLRWLNVIMFKVEEAIFISCYNPHLLVRRFHVPGYAMRA